MFDDHISDPTVSIYMCICGADCCLISLTAVWVCMFPVATVEEGEGEGNGRTEIASQFAPLLQETQQPVRLLCTGLL